LRKTNSASPVGVFELVSAAQSPPSAWPPSAARAIASGVNQFGAFALGPGHALAQVTPGDFITWQNASKVKELVSPGVYQRIEHGTSSIITAANPRTRKRIIGIPSPAMTPLTTVRLVEQLVCQEGPP
jgi:hypothetical protein